jgi:hypothetical protein
LFFVHAPVFHLATCRLVRVLLVMIGEDESLEM